MNGQEALRIVNRLLEQNCCRSLKTLQTQIVLQVWDRNSYQQIGRELGYEPEYVKQVAAQLWRLLSELVGKKVCKSNLCSMLENYQRSLTITDWGEANLGSRGYANDVSLFYGRQAELETLEDWIIGSRCRLVGIFGWGGIGKTTLSVKLAQRLESQFEYVVWRSLRHAPILNDLLAELLSIFTASSEGLASSEVEGSRTDAQVRKSLLGLLMKQLRSQRCLLVLDNVESILQQGDARCSYLSGYEDYGEMFDRISAERHQSCTILTGREKPQGIMQREGVNLPVRSIQLTGLSIAAAQHILIDKGLESPQLDREELIHYVGGNPLMLKLVATTVQNLFNGDIMAFLTEGTGVFSSLQDLLAQQFDRLSPLQQQVMYWLAINREGVTLARLKAEFLPAITLPILLEALETLKDRSAILLCRRCANETTDRGFTQQPAMMEYVTDRLIQEIDREIIAGELDLLRTHALLEPQAQDYIRSAQIQLILQPLVDRLLTHFTTRASLEQQLSNIYIALRYQPDEITGYAAENLLDIFCYLNSDLQDCNCSRHVLIPTVDAARSQLAAMEFTHLMNHE